MTALKKKQLAPPQRKAQGKPRKCAVPVWRRVWFRGAAVALILAIVGGGGVWMTQSGTASRFIEQVKWQGIAVSVRAGLEIQEVLVAGKINAQSSVLLAALGTTRGAPILAFNVELARKRVEGLPWVRRASVERLLPSTIMLSVEERRPLALWQHDGEFALIDYEGQVILREGLGSYSDFLVVVGDDAPQHAANLIETLGSQPELMKHVRAAIRVGGRRWNLRLAGGIDVQLPEDDAPSAWLRLAQYQRSHSVLERDVKIVDLRLPDRLIVRKLPDQQTISLKLGQET